MLLLAYNIKAIGNKVPDFTKLVAKAALNTKVTEIHSKTPIITNLATKIENEIPDTAGFITTPEFNR